MTWYKRLREPSVVFALAIVGGSALGCGADATAPVSPGFLGGTANNHQVGVVLTDLDKTLTLFQLGLPANQEHIALGSSSTVTPTGFSVRGQRVSVPLGDAASVALINLATQGIQRVFTFARGNATGSTFADDTTILAADLLQNLVGRMTVNQTDDAISQTATVAPQPTAITMAGGRAIVVSANLDANFAPLGNGIVTALDPKTLQVIGTATMGGTNSSDAAVGPDGLVYVLNTGDFVGQGSMTILNPATMTVVTTIQNVGVGPGAISIDAGGLAYVSSFFSGTVVWNTATRQFVRGPENPVCAKLATGTCRGAFATTTAANGDVYQAFFGSASQGLAPYVFVYKAGTFTLVDSVAVGSGPIALAVRTF